jgi:hypothetical protein
MTEHARALNPDIAVDSNAQSVFGFNQALVHGVNSTAQLAFVDIMCDECPDWRPDDDPDAIPRSTVKMRGMNLARSLGKSVFTAYRDEEGLAFNLAFGGSPGINAHWGYAEPRKLALQDPQPGVKPLLDLFAARKELYCELRPLARVGVWRNQRSLAWVSFDTHLSACVMEHVLFKRRIPFRIVQDEFINEEALRDFDLLIVPNVEYVTDAQASALEEFVSEGGALLITEQSGSFDDWARQRTVPAFARLFGASLAASSQKREESTSFDPNAQFTMARAAGTSATACCGKGRVAYLDTIDYRYGPRTFKSGHNGHYDAIDSRYWKDPYNVDEILSLVEWLKPDCRPVGIIGHPEARLDWVRFRDGEEGCLLIRCGALAGPADLCFAARADAAPKQAHLYVPETPEPLTLDWTSRGEWIETVLPRVVRHAVVKYSP